MQLPNERNLAELGRTVRKDRRETKQVAGDSVLDLA